MLNWIRNYKNSSKKLTVENVRNFLVAKWRVLKGIKWEHDQEAWRLKQVAKTSPKCLSQGFCSNCYCEWKDGLAFEDKPCETGCYPRWMTKREWEFFTPLPEDQKEKFIKYFL